MKSDESSDLLPRIALWLSACGEGREELMTELRDESRGLRRGLSLCLGIEPSLLRAES